MSRTGVRLSKYRLQRRFCCGCRSGRGAPLPLCLRAWWTASQVQTINPGTCRPGVKLLLDDTHCALTVIEAQQQCGSVQATSRPRWVWCGRRSCHTTHSRARWRARSCHWAPAAPRWHQPSQRQPPACWWMSMSAQPGAITACPTVRPTCCGAALKWHSIPAIERSAVCCLLLRIPPLTPCAPPWLDEACVAGAGCCTGRACGCATCRTSRWR
jgi:hypothetical protein